jgi:hypothetical protein
MYAEYITLLSYLVNKEVLARHVDRTDPQTFVKVWKLWQQAVLSHCDDYFRDWTAGHANSAHGHRQTVVTTLLNPKVDPSMKPLLDEIYDQFEYVAFKMVEDRINAGLRNRDRVLRVNKEAEASHDNAVWAQDSKNIARRSDTLGHNMPNAISRVMPPRTYAHRLDFGKGRID